MAASKNGLRVGGADISREISALTWGSLVNQFAPKHDGGKPRQWLGLPLWKRARRTYKYNTLRLLALALRLIARAARRAQNADENKGRGGRQNVLKIPSPETALVTECARVFAVYCPSQIRRGGLLNEFVAACYEIATGRIDQEFERAVSDQVREYHKYFRSQFDECDEFQLRLRVRHSATSESFDQHGQTEYKAARDSGWDHADAMEIALERGGAFRSWRL